MKRCHLPMSKYQPAVALGILLSLQCSAPLLVQAQDSDKGAPTTDSLPKPVAGDSTKPVAGDAAPGGGKKHNMPVAARAPVVVTIIIGVRCPSSGKSWGCLP